VDGPLTPDYAVLGQPGQTPCGWMESGCSLIGVDRRVARRALDTAALKDEQKLYVTWNTSSRLTHADEGVRMAWTGATWETDGDLFLYLDTRASAGSRAAFNPYLILEGGSVTLDHASVTLPDGFYADFLVWVEDSATASLLGWDGSTWQWLKALAVDQLRFTPAAEGARTDIYLPFGWLGIADPASRPVKLLAFASDEEALRLWATMPPGNALSSEKVTGAAAGLGDGHDVTLSQAYRWAGLGAGICPNGSQFGVGDHAYPDVDPQAALSADPQGSSYSLLSDGVYWFRDLLAGSTTSDVIPYLSALDGSQPPLTPGQKVTFTLSYRNRGTDSAVGVTAIVTPHYALALPGAPASLALGDVGPGEEAAATLRGQVNPTQSSGTWVGLEVAIHDARHPVGGDPFEWLWYQHSVDRTPPRFFGIEEPAYFVAPGLSNVIGYAYDESGVPEIGLEVEGAGMLVCPDNAPDDGRWACQWNLSGGHGDEFLVKLQATDGAGHDGAWADSLPFVVDARPPTLTVDLSVLTGLSGGVAGRAGLNLVGDVSDDSGVASVRVCTDGGCEAALLQGRVTPATAVLRDRAGSGIAVGAGTGCTDPITRAFTITEPFPVGRVLLGFTAEHARRDELAVDLTSPQGTTVALLAGRDGSVSGCRNYDVLLEDAAPRALHDGAGDDDPTGEPYDRHARPLNPMQRFQGEDAAGTWVLSICDENPAANHGVYLHSTLTLVPRNRGARTGRWSYSVSALNETDYVSTTWSVYARDSVGNETLDPATISLWMDTVPPVITVTQQISSVTLGEAQTVLGGTVADGGPAADVSVEVTYPDGSVASKAVARDGDRWWYAPSLREPGRYTLRVVATDAAGNTSTVGPFTLDVGCTAADLTAGAISAEPLSEPTGAIQLTAVISNTGRESAPAALTVAFYDYGTRIGTLVTSQPIAPAESLPVSIVWLPERAGAHEIVVVPNDPDVPHAPLVLCEPPAAARRALYVLDLDLYPAWNLVSGSTLPFKGDIETVQRSIVGSYAVIMGFDQGALSYYPDLPSPLNTLTTIDAEHGYWIKVEGLEPLTASGQEEEPDDDPVAALTLIGERLPEDYPLSLDPGWNLVSYLPHGSLPVAQALAVIDGLYTAVLAFEGGAVSYYPDLDATYNTLSWMRPGHGYWINMRQAATLQYSVTHSLPRTALMPGSPSVAHTPAIPVGSTEGLPSPSLNVRPTNTWVNFYGPAESSDGQALPPGTVVAAVDPDGVRCGAVTIAVEGQYGLLPCYGDDPTTAADEGADPGDTIELVVGGQAVGQGIWMGHGERTVVPLGVGVTPARRHLYLPLILRAAVPPLGTSAPYPPTILQDPTAAPTSSPTAEPLPPAAVETLIVPIPLPTAMPPTSPLVTPSPGAPETDQAMPTATLPAGGTPQTGSQ